MNTEDPQLKSFIKVERNSDFPIQNLPYGIFSRTEDGENKKVGVAIGEFVLDLSVLEQQNLFEGIIIQDKAVFLSPTLNSFMELGRNVWVEIRRRISSFLQDKPGKLRDNEDLKKEAFVAMKDVTLHLPVQITDYTDFYASKHHAFNVGTMFRGPENALMPNWLHLPVGYHGRASSVIVSGIDIHRPMGQTIKPNEKKPTFGPSKRLDYEFEMGFFIGTENTLGKPIPINKAKDHIFGMVIVNDWSARDIQAWEYQPLGPFLAKNFATSISPWVVTLDALSPFIIEDKIQDPKPLPYLYEKNRVTYDITLEVHIKTEKMKQFQKIVTSNFKNLYWSMEQMLTHHSVTGCNMQTGDLLASGTISGSTKESRACLLETTWKGEEPFMLTSGEQRIFLEDGDSVLMTAYCQGGNYRIGFGDVEAKILPAYSDES